MKLRWFWLGSAATALVAFVAGCPSSGGTGSGQMGAQEKATAKQAATEQMKHMQEGMKTAPESQIPKDMQQQMGADMQRMIPAEFRKEAGLGGPAAKPAAKPEQKPQPPQKK